MPSKRKAPKCKKIVKSRPNCKIEKSEYFEEIREMFWAFESVKTIAEVMNKRGFELSENNVRRWSVRSGEFAARAKDTDHILNTVIERGFDRQIQLDGRVGIAALKLRMQKHKEIDSSTNINIQIIKTPEQINERINNANRLLPILNGDN